MSHTWHCNSAATQGIHWIPWDRHLAFPLGIGGEARSTSLWRYVPWCFVSLPKIGHERGLFCPHWNDMSSGFLFIFRRCSISANISFRISLNSFTAISLFVFLFLWYILTIQKSSTPYVFNITRLVYCDTTVIKSIQK